MEIRVTSALVGALVALSAIALMMIYDLRTRVESVNQKVSAIENTLNSAEITQ